MPAHLQSPHGRARAVAVRLAADFDGVLPLGTVEAEVEAAERELRGQIPPGSLDEMLHRLAGQRLAERIGADR
ncbi:MAG TPA: hypothetical protein VD813_05230 [Pseudonocardia sp.]|nr:hypothetical protein [Pseudonocardia sp.]